MAQDGPHVDRLITGTLRYPLLNSYYGSAEQKADVTVIAAEIKRRYLAKLSSHRVTGNLARTARIVYNRVEHLPDRRWEAEFVIGGTGADYADDVDRKYHILAEVLREMGVQTYDSMIGPTGRIPAEQREPTEAKRAAPHRATSREREAAAGVAAAFAEVNNESKRKAFRTKAEADAERASSRQVLSQKEMWALRDKAELKQISREEYNAQVRTNLQAELGEEGRQAMQDDLSNRIAQFGLSGRKGVSKAKDQEYKMLLQAAQKTQAIYGNEEARGAYSALTAYRLQREAEGLEGNPRGDHYRDTSFEHADEERGARGGITWAGRQMGLLAPEDVGEKED